MAELYRFFNSTVDDKREYQAGEFAEYFASFISNGILSQGNELGLRARAGSGMDITIDKGFAFVRGYLYHNTDTLTKTIEASDTVLNRIDRVVLKLDIVNRKINIDIKKGSLASNPNPPSLEDTGTVKELSLARVIVNAKATSVTIQDERLTEFCGLASLLIDIPLDEMQDEFDSWMDSINGILNESTAGNLLDLIQTNTANITNLQNNKLDKSKIKVSSVDAVSSEMAEGDIWIKYS